MSVKRGPFLRFKKRPRRRGYKTDEWEVWTGGKPYEEGGPRFAELGEVRWWSPWRRYVFYPSDGTLFDAGCLREIEDFLTKLMAARATPAPTLEDRDGE